MLKGQFTPPKKIIINHDNFVIISLSCLVVCDMYCMTFLFCGKQKIFWNQLKMYSLLFILKSSNVVFNATDFHTIPPSLHITLQSHTSSKTHELAQADQANLQNNERWCWWRVECNAVRLDYLMSHSVCNSLMEHADDVSCLCEQSVRRYANTYIDRQVG